MWQIHSKFYLNKISLSRFARAVFENIKVKLEKTNEKFEFRLPIASFLCKLCSDLITYLLLKMCNKNQIDRKL
jgi:hypothetical protein